MALACLNDSQLNFDSRLTLNVNSCLESILSFEDNNYPPTISIGRKKAACGDVTQFIPREQREDSRNQWWGVTSDCHIFIGFSPVFEDKRRQWWQLIYECHLVNLVASKLRHFIRLYRQRNILTITPQISMAKPQFILGYTALLVWGSLCGDPTFSASPLYYTFPQNQQFRVCPPRGRARRLRIGF